MRSVLVAHRGEPETWPENSLAGFDAVLKAGASFLETDVQITADGLAVLSHDPSLLKITGHDALICQTDSRTVLALSAGYPDRFGEKFQALKITRLDQFAELLKRWPEAKAFIEIKQACMDTYGITDAVDIVLDILTEVLDQCVIISFEYAALVYVREVSRVPVGFVLPEWSAETQLQATELVPEYLFCNRQRLPEAKELLWKGSWCWVVYTVNEALEIEHFLARGIDMVETNVISQLLGSDES